MLGRLAAWFVADALGPHLVGKAVDRLGGRPEEFPDQMVRLLGEEIPGRQLAAHRKALLRFFDADTTWEAFVYPTSDRFDSVVTELAEILELPANDASSVLDCLCAQFLTCLDPGMSVAVLDYRRGKDHACVLQALQQMQSVLETGTAVASGQAATVRIKGDRNSVKIVQGQMLVQASTRLRENLLEVAELEQDGLLCHEAVAKIQHELYMSEVRGRRDD